MLKKIVFFVALLPMLLVAQRRVEVPAQYVNNHSQSVFDKGIKYQGSPYLDKKFVVGKVILNNSKIINTELRYNAYSDNFEFYNKDVIVSLLKIDGTKVELAGKIFVLKSLKSEKSTSKNYYQKLTDKGRLNLYKKYYKKFIDAKKAKSSYSSDKPAKFELVTSYLIEKQGNEGLQLLQLKKKAIFLLMKDKESDIKKYFKSEKLKLSKEKDIVKLFNYYNSL